MAEGVIFTNLQALARKFGTDAAAVRKLLAAYAEASAAHGIRYRIVDAGDYVFLNPEAGRNRAVALSPADSWVEHGYLLADYYRFGRSTADDETNYLFIVGGADVIPMPVLPQYISDPDYSDTDIDSDIPYAYLLGERTYPMLGTTKFSSTNNISIRDACRWRMTRRWTTRRIPAPRGQSPRFDGRGQGLRADRPHVAFGLGFGQRAFPPQSTLPG